MLSLIEISFRISCNPSQRNLLIPEIDKRPVSFLSFTLSDRRTKNLSFRCLLPNPSTTTLHHLPSHPNTPNSTASFLAPLFTPLPHHPILAPARLLIFGIPVSPASHFHPSPALCFPFFFFFLYLCIFILSRANQFYLMMSTCLWHLCCGILVLLSFVFFCNYM